MYLLLCCIQLTLIELTFLNFYWAVVFRLPLCCSALLQCAIECRNVPQCVAVRCSVLQCVAVCCSVYLAVIIQIAAHHTKFALEQSDTGIKIRLHFFLGVILVLHAFALHIFPHLRHGRQLVEMRTVTAHDSLECLALG